MKIVIYFTYTGHTKIIAEKIKEKLGCDILKLEPVIPYSNDYNKVVDDEQNSGSSNILPEIKDIDIDLSKYDEIIIGTPVWWYRPAPVVRAFLKKYDLSGEKVIPFATNAGWLGKGLSEIKTFCPNSEVVDEMNIVFSTNYEENKLVTNEYDIDSWINKL